MILSICIMVDIVDIANDQSVVPCVPISVQHQQHTMLANRNIRITMGISVFLQACAVLMNIYNLLSFQSLDSCRLPTSSTIDDIYRLSVLWTIHVKFEVSPPTAAARRGPSWLSGYYINIDILVMNMGIGCIFKAWHVAEACTLSGWFNERDGYVVVECIHLRLCYMPACNLIPW